MACQRLSPRSGRSGFVLHTLPNARALTLPACLPAASPAVLGANPGRMVVLMASVTWCRPCRAFQEKYEVRPALLCSCRIEQCGLLC